MSLYWDDFERRITETVSCIKRGVNPPIRRVAVFITNKCNFRCSYCRVKFGIQEMEQSVFDKICADNQDAIIHITGGEPSMVSWLYDYIDSHKGIFNLNTNAYIAPPKNVKRIKISLDSSQEDYVNELVGIKDAFRKIIENIKYASQYSTVSITCVVSKDNYKILPEFVKFCNKEFPNIYAIFFSAYKGSNPRFAFSGEDIKELFNKVFPEMKKLLNQESLWLLNETLDDKIRVIQGIRFPENRKQNKCYLCLSEKVVDWTGNEFRCSHLYRDGIFSNDSLKTNECLYGCNRKLIKFNEEVEQRIKGQLHLTPDEKGEGKWQEEMRVEAEEVLVADDGAGTVAEEVKATEEREDNQDNFI